MKAYFILKAISLLTPIIVVLVTSCAPNNPAHTDVVDFETTQQNADALTVTFSTNQNAEVYRWNFGDGTSGDTREETHRFLQPGDYNVTLTVLSNEREATVSKIIPIPLGGSNSVISGKLALNTDIFQIGQVNLTSRVQASSLSSDEVIVTFRDEKTPLTLFATDVRLEHVRQLGGSRSHLFRSQHTLTEKDVKALTRYPKVLDATLNRLVISNAVPNDTYYPNQWNLATVGLPLSDLPAGLEPSVVAVVDTGILFDVTNPAFRHPDLPDSLLPGYDFISDIDRAQDGDGRDANPFDLGNYFENGNHGSHIAGIIAAATNNNQGISGASNAQLYAVRVLGSNNSGIESDVLDGIAWAAGLPVEGVPLNEHPADVINLSLGVEGRCSQAQQQLFDELERRGVLVVAAAGNANINVNNLAPANCEHVIAVGATDARGYRATYSNYGTELDVMAPGGDSRSDKYTDGLPDGILSLGSAPDGRFGYGLIAGTSMASPHVSALLSIMKMLNPDIQPEDARNILSETASPLNDAECAAANQPNLRSQDCAAGLMNAERAIRRILGSATTPLAYSPPVLTFTADEDTRSLSLSNPLPRSVAWTLSETTGQVQIQPSSGVLLPSERVDLEVSLANAAEEISDLKLKLTANGKEEPIKVVSTSIATRNATSLQGTYVIACLWLSGECRQQGSQIQQLPVSGSETTYALADLQAAEYQLYAWKDTDSNDKLSVGDLLGTLDTRVTPPMSQVNFSVEVVLPDTQIPAPLESFLARKP